MDFLRNIYNSVIKYFYPEPNVPNVSYDLQCEAITLRKLKCKNKKLYGVSNYYCWVHNKLLPKKIIIILSEYMCKEEAYLCVAAM